MNSRFNAAAKHDDAEYDATTYDGSIRYGNADDATTVYTNDAASNDASATIIPGRSGHFNRWPASNATEANISGLQVRAIIHFQFQYFYFNNSMEFFI